VDITHDGNYHAFLKTWCVKRLPQGIAKREQNPFLPLNVFYLGWPRPLNNWQPQGPSPHEEADRGE